ncbi:DUF4136 domain-containing protein [Flammeovirgaceae bacterium SG7u.111]|nr:DUF4136 domain-containing protein [Flammeovirgaceae bacterium SG7u.132]WPO36079.1 DUF4136 domain-containing protein [Flammeovirgaceae bacterium SG7u.111]
MKKIALIITSMLLAIGLTNAQDYTVASDRLPEHDFSEYKTFDWASGAKIKENSFYTLNDYILKNSIMDAIKGEMEGLGYEQSTTSPDLLINFLVFEKPTKFRGYGKVVETNDTYYEYWSSFGSDMKLNGVKEYDLAEGTLLIHMIDKKTGAMVWQGYASGIMDNDVFDRDKERIKEAVELVFEKYHERADDFTTGE